MHFSSLIPKVSTFSLAISYLTTSNWPCFMELTSRFLCNIEFTASDLASITSHVHSWVLFLLCLCLLILLDLFLHWSPVAYSAPTNPRSSSFSILSFCLFILFMGFSRQEYWSGLPFPSPVVHILSELSTMTLHGMAHSFIELDKAAVHVIRLVSFLWLWFSVCLPSDG